MSEKHSADLTGQDWLDHLDEEHGWALPAPTVRITVRDRSYNTVAIMKDVEPSHAESLISEWIRAGVGKLVIELTLEIP